MISGCRIQRGRLIRVTMIPRRRRVRYSVQSRLGRGPVRLLAGRPLLTTGHSTNRRSWWCGGNDDLRCLLLLLLLLLLRRRLRLLTWVLNPIVSTITIVLIGCIWPSWIRWSLLIILGILLVFGKIWMTSRLGGSRRRRWHVLISRCARTIYLRSTGRSVSTLFLSIVILRTRVCGRCSWRLRGRRRLTGYRLLLHGGGMSLRSRHRWIAVTPRVGRRCRRIASGSLLTASVSVIYVLSSSVARRHVTTRITPVDIRHVWRIMRSWRVWLTKFSLLRQRVCLRPNVLLLRIVLIRTRVLVTTLLYSLMGGRRAALTGWPRWRWCIFRRRATGCTARVTTLIISIAIHGSIARSASGKRVLRIGRTRRWYGSSSLGALLLRACLDLVDDGLWIHSSAIEVTFVCQQMLRIVFTQCISSAATRTDAQQAGYILPCFVFRYLHEAPPVLHVEV